MNYLVLNIGLALAWTALTGQYNPANLVIGAILGYGALFVSRRAIGPSSYFVKVRQVFTFVGLFQRPAWAGNGGLMRGMPR